MVLFAERLEDVLPRDHSVRVLDEILQGIDWSPWEARYHGRLGQPAIHPRVLASVLLYGLLTRVRTSRSLEEALLVRLDFRWLAEGRAIDHTTLSEFRRRNDEPMKHLFVQVCLVARRMGLLGLQQLAFDGTRVRANNRRSGTRTPAELREMQRELAARYDELAAQITAEETREAETFGLGSAHRLPAELADLQRRREEVAAALAEIERVQAAGETVPTRVPLTDPQSRLTPNKEGGFAPNYTPLATVDVESGLVVHAEVIAMTNEDQHLTEAIDQVRRDFSLAEPPPEMLADGMMATGPNLEALAERGVTLYSPVPLPDPNNPALRDDPTQPVPPEAWDQLPTKTAKAGGQKREQLDKAAFVYDEARDCYWCPLGKPLPHVGTTSEPSGSGRRVRERYQAAAADCAACPLRERCLLGNAQRRQISHDQHEKLRVEHAERMATPEAQKKYARRRHGGERPFAMIKHHFGARRFLLRGLERVRAEWRWLATAFNLHRLMSLIRGRAGPSAIPSPLATT
jgi:transposase